MGMAAAAMLCIGVGWHLLIRQIEGISIGMLPSDHAGESMPMATFVGDSDLIVVPVASHAPDVTVVRVYPVYEPDYSAQASVEPTSAGDSSAWPDLNGG
jgi:hypothetical protein